MLSSFQSPEHSIHPLNRHAIFTGYGVAPRHHVPSDPLHFVPFRESSTTGNLARSACNVFRLIRIRRDPVVVPLRSMSGNSGCETARAGDVDTSLRAVDYAGPGSRPMAYRQLWHTRCRECRDRATLTWIRVRWCEDTLRF